MTTHFLHGNCLTPDGKCGDEDEAKTLEKASELADSDRIVVFSKTYCPYCKALKNLIAEKFSKEHVDIVELDTHPKGAEIQAMLAKKTGQRTVPNLFVKGKHVGGWSEASDAYQKGDLHKLLA